MSSTNIDPYAALASVIEAARAHRDATGPRDSRETGHISMRLEVLREKIATERHVILGFPNSLSDRTYAASLAFLQVANEALASAISILSLAK